MTYRLHSSSSCFVSFSSSFRLIICCLCVFMSLFTSSMIIFFTDSKLKNLQLLTDEGKSYSNYVQLIPMSMHFSIFDSIVYSGFAKESLKRRREMTLSPLIRRKNDFYDNVKKHFSLTPRSCQMSGRKFVSLRVYCL